MKGTFEAVNYIIVFFVASAMAGARPMSSDPVPHLSSTTITASETVLISEPTGTATATSISVRTLISAAVRSSSGTPASAGTVTSTGSAAISSVTPQGWEPLTSETALSGTALSIPQTETVVSVQSVDPTAASSAAAAASSTAAAKGAAGANVVPSVAVAAVFGLAGALIAGL